MDDVIIFGHDYRFWIFALYLNLFFFWPRDDRHRKD